MVKKVLDSFYDIPFYDVMSFGKQNWEFIKEPYMNSCFELPLLSHSLLLA